MKNLLLAFGMAVASLTGFHHTSAQAEVTECTEITTVPMSITAQGLYCLKGNLLTGISTGTAISIETNNVTIDMNGWRIGGLAGGDASTAIGISSLGRKNVTVRNGSIRGFAAAIQVSDASSSRHRYEDLVIDGAKSAGIIIAGTNHTIRNNQIWNTGDSSVLNGAAGILGSGGLLISSNIIGNTISGVLETSTSNGLRLSSGGLMNVIKDNTITNVIGSAADIGIILSNMSDTIIQGNRIINQEAVQGQVGISIGSSANIVCAENIVDGFNIALVGCNTNVDNITP